MKPLSEEQRDEILEWALECSSLTDGFDYSGFKDWINQNTRKYEAPAVIYKTDGFTGAMRGER